MEQEEKSFEERWRQLLDNTRTGLKNLDKENRDNQIRNLWTDINKYVTIMAVPKEVLPKARKTLMKMAWKSSFAMSLPIFLYALMTYLPRKWYRNVETQHWFKQRLGNKNNQ